MEHENRLTQKIVFGALASMACAPGSTGMGKPYSACPTTTPSRLNSKPGRSLSGATAIVSLASAGFSQNEHQ